MEIFVLLQEEEYLRTTIKGIVVSENEAKSWCKKNNKKKRIGGMYFFYEKHTIQNNPIKGEEE